MLGRIRRSKSEERGKDVFGSSKKRVIASQTCEKVVVWHQPQGKRKFIGERSLAGEEKNTPIV